MTAVVVHGARVGFTAIGVIGAVLLVGAFGGRRVLDAADRVAGWLGGES